MAATKACSHAHAGGRPCAATPMRSGKHCFWHDPEKSAEADEARRLGGLRRKRERTVASVYDLAGFGDRGAVRRLLEVAVIDTLGLENSVARSRVLLAAAVVATKLVEAEREAGMAWSVED